MSRFDAATGVRLSPPGNGGWSSALPGGLAVLLACAGAVVYAQQAAAEVAYRLIVEGAIVVCWLAAAAGWGAWLTGWLWPSQPSGSRRSGLLGTATASAIGLGMMSLVILLTGLAGLLSAVTGWLLIGVGLLAGLAWIVRWRKRTNAQEPRPADDAVFNRWRWLWLAVAPALALALAAAYVAPGLLWKPEEPHGYDVVEYHFQIPREWHDSGRIEPLAHNVFSYFPFAVEMHYLLAMHLRGGAWDGIYLAQLMHVGMVALSVLAAYAIACKLAHGRGQAVLAAVAGGTVPWLMQLAPLGFNEGGLLLYGTLAMGWVAIRLAPAAALEGPGAGPPAADGEKDGSYRSFAMAGLCAGFGCGVKLTAVPLLLLAIPAVVAALMARRAPRQSLATCAIFVAAGLLVFSPWLVRNVAWTGNPVFPEGRALFGNEPFSEVQADRWQQAHAAQPAQQPIARRLAALGSEVLFNWQFGWLLPPLTIVALAVGWRITVGRLLIGLLAIQTAVWLGLTHLQGRFFVLAIPVGIFAIAAAPWEVVGRPRITLAVLAVLIVGASGFSWYQVHRRLAYKLYEDRGTGISVALGQTDVSWITHDAIAGFPQDDPSTRLLLVGDAQAFWYPVPAGRLRYRTIFDLDTSGGRSLLDAFDPAGLRHDGKTWLLVTPTELERYQNTYQPLPPIPDAWRQSPQWQDGRPFLIPPTAIPQWEQQR